MPAPSTPLIAHADEPIATLLLAHGAGAPMDSPFMNALTDALVAQQVTVVRFEFPYMQRRRQSGVKSPPDRQPVLLATFEQVLAETSAMLKPAPCFIGGKSMGGRMASLLATRLAVPGVCCFGYPFHPPGKKASPRIAHLMTLPAPCLIVQGTRDPFGKPDEVQGYALPETVQVAWLEQGNHDFEPTRKSGLTQQQLIEQAAAHTTRFMQRAITAR